MPDGTYRATYVHYDGYSSNMQILKTFSRDQIELFVTEGWLRGGIRLINQLSGPEYFNDPSWEGGRIHTAWSDRKESYAYMLRLDGSWVYIGHDVDGEKTL